MLCKDGELIASFVTFHHICSERRPQECVYGWLPKRQPCVTGETWRKPSRAENCNRSLPRVCEAVTKMSSTRLCVSYAGPDGVRALAGSCCYASSWVDIADQYLVLLLSIKPIDRRCSEMCTEPHTPALGALPGDKVSTGKVAASQCIKMPRA